jgi:hypothetical protein
MLQRIDEIGKIAVPCEQVEVAPDRLLDVVLEHREDEFFLALEVRIERPARETGGGRDRLDAGATDPLFLEHARSGLEQLFAGVVPGRSGPDS